MSQAVGSGGMTQKIPVTGPGRRSPTRMRLTVAVAPGVVFTALTDTLAFRVVLPSGLKIDQIVDTV
jgi:hypothetical protein